MNYYDSVKQSHGMSAMYTTQRQGIRSRKIQITHLHANPKIVVPTDSPKLGIYKDVPVYAEFLKIPICINT